MNKHLTTNECAEYCGVSSRTVHKWFDAGQLKGFMIPGSNHRRIPHENLVKFMTEHGIPIPDELRIETKP